MPSTLQDDGGYFAIYEPYQTYVWNTNQWSFMPSSS